MYKSKIIESCHEIKEASKMFQKSKKGKLWSMNTFRFETYFRRQACEKTVRALFITTTTRSQVFLGLGHASRNI